MVRSSKGFRSGTRRKLKCKLRDKFKPEDYMPKFKVGDRVTIYHNPASQKGMPHPRFKSATGLIIEQRGLGYMVNVKDGKKEKRVVVRVEHLKPAN